MAKSDGILGISVRHGKLSLSTLKGDKIQKTTWEEIPENIVDDYKILSQNLFSEFLKEKIKESGIKCKKVAYALSDADVFIKNISMPQMDDEQLKLNIPFEFRDLIQGELKEYTFDFIKRPQDDPDSKTIDLLAYSIPVELIKSLDTTLKLAGLRLEFVVPETIVYETILARLGDEEETRKERCFLDIGTNHISMRVFKNGAYKLSHVIDIGERHIVAAIADELNVDMHLALTYLRQNFEDAQNCTGAMNAYKDISIEILKGLNFYEMSDMTSRLGNVVLCGAGALIEPLVSLLGERIDKSVVTIQDLLYKQTEERSLNVTFASVAILRSDIVAKGTNHDIAKVMGKKETNWYVAVPAIIAICIGAGLISKFAVLDRFTALARAKGYEAQLETQLMEQKKIISDSDEITKEYYHYTWDGMSEEEKARVSRLKVANIVDLIGKQGLKINSLDLKGEQFTVNVSGNNLESISKLTELLDEQDIIESCSVESAKTNDKEEIVTNQIKTENEDGEEVETKVTEIAQVDAQINVYLKTDDDVKEEGSEN